MGRDVLAALHSSGAALRGREPSASEDGCEIPPAPAGVSAALASDPARATVCCRLERLGWQYRRWVQRDDGPPPEPIFVLLRNMGYESGELEPVQPALHAFAVCLEVPSERGLILGIWDGSPSHDWREAHDQLAERARKRRGALASGPLLPSPPPP